MGRCIKRSIALRPFGLSVIYLLLYLLAPLVIVPDTQTFSGGCRTYLLLTLILSFLLLLTHAAWHSVLAAFAPYGSLLKDYPIIQKIGHNLGLVSYAGIDPQMAVHYLAPELVMSGVSLLVYLLVKKLLTRNETGLHKKDSKHQRYPLLTSAGKYVCLFLIMFSGIMRPSISSGIYFLVFMGAATAWAVGRPLEKGFAVVSRCVMAIMAVHIAILVAYQCSYFGLTKLVSINETTPTSFTYEVTRDQWATIASPLVILLTYFILAIETRELFKPKLIKSMSPSKRWSSIRSGSQSKQLHQDSTGSVVIPDEESAIEGENTLLDDIVAAIVDFFQVLVR
ncbi:unnamed protein product [Diatraea saccharalis]|uniref:Piezo TM1-24 domain-containing protein n=1 Tax=Diatraea saccharalis TaxID=40085 RepID=A0A9N9QVK4_9NEOP|nr:unnamed protein product [Diatraea saccharalis]